MDPQPALPFSAPQSILASPDSSAYTPRCPEDAALFGVVADNLESFLAGAERADRVVPRFVEREFRTFLECGSVWRQVPAGGSGSSDWETALTWGTSQFRRGRDARASPA